MALDKVLADIDADLDGSLARLFDFLRIPSISTDRAYAADCRRAGQWLADDLATLGRRASSAKFAHGAFHELPDGRLLADSYHCSRYNTNTGVLTPEMFRKVFARVRGFLGAL